MEENIVKTPKLLLSFVVDNSASVPGEKLGELMRAFRAFGSELPAFLEWELLTFDTLTPAVVKRFDSAEIAPVSANRFPLLGRAVQLAADRTEARCRALQEAGETVYRPWIFLLSGGFTADAMEEVTARLDAMEKKEELLYLPFKLTERLATERLQCMDRSKHMIEILPEGVEGFFAFVKGMIAQREALPPETGVRFSKTDFEGWAVL
ncbi:MAG: hypothetical protein E7590_08415 [Ruminococcaceae bacterium]|nr:hypothetical protein [Oscillospiraceae bacterium]